MSEFVSTRNSKNRVSSPEAIVEGLAKDGGLFVPDRFDQQFNICDFKRKSYEEIAYAILHSFFNDLDQKELREAIHHSAMRFNTPEEIAIHHAGNDCFMELYHGPTSAFKDVALTLLPHLLSISYKSLKINKKIMILTATSGDTGKAALEGFKDVENTEITVFYPSEGVSEVQKTQMVTTEGRNTHVVSVKGNFDDCQRLVKNAYQLVDCGEKITLSSANSINIGRLAPQIVYYFVTYVRLLEKGKIEENEEISFCVPTGNFGDILAGYMAKLLGCPIRRLICASNMNNVLTEFIETGIYNSKRSFHTTISPSMDILVSSNLERLLYILCRDDKEVSGYMDQLNSKGSYCVSNEMLQKIQNEFCAYYTDEDSCKAAIKEVYEKYGYVIDPHTAVAYCATQKYHKENSEKVVTLSTASPYKFSRSVLGSITSAPEDEFEAMRILSEFTKTEIPFNLANLKDLPVRHNVLISPDEGIAYIERLVKELC